VSLVLYRLAGSPNNLKVETALRYKEIPFEAHDATPHDRRAVLEATGQPLMPAIVHDGRTLFDSSAILRYLDANFPGTKPLFARDFEGMKAIERWETLARNEWIRPTGLVFRQAIADAPDLDVCAEARRLATTLSEPLEAELSGRDWLVGSTMTAADVVGACSWIYASLPAWLKKSGPLQGFFAEQLRFEAPRPAMERWIARVAAYAEPLPA